MDCLTLAQLACEDDVFAKLIDEDIMIPVVAIVAGCSVAIIGILAGMVTKVTVGRAREQTRRELAAYVAEGTLDPDKAVALMNAGKSANGCGGDALA